MKKLFTILCAVMLTFSLSAQTETGTMLIEGGSNFNYSSITLNSVEFDGESVDVEDADATNTMGLNVTGAYFMMDGLAVGLVLDYSSTSVDGEGTSAMAIGPMVRYYIGESGMFAGLSYLMGSSDDGGDYDQPTSSTLGIGVGYMAMLSDNISINPSLGYAMHTEKLGDDFKMKYSGIGLNVGIAVHLGN